MGNRHSLGGGESRRQSAESNRRPLEERLMFPFLDEENNVTFRKSKLRKGRKSASLVPGGKPADFNSTTPAGREDPHLLRVLCQHAALDDADGIERACRDEGAEKHVNERTARSGMSALHVAAQHGNAGAFSALLRHGADLSMLSGSGKKAIDYAVEAKSMRVIQLIVEQQVPTDTAAPHQPPSRRRHPSPSPRKNARAAPTEPASTFSPMPPARSNSKTWASEPSSTIVQAFSKRPANRPLPDALAEMSEMSVGSPHDAPSWDLELDGDFTPNPSPPRSETQSLSLCIIKPVGILKRTTPRPSMSPPAPPATPPPIFRAATFACGSRSPAHSASKHAHAPCTPSSSKKHKSGAPRTPSSARKGEAPSTPDSSQKRPPLGAHTSSSAHNVQLQQWDGGSVQLQQWDGGSVQLQQWDGGSAPVSPHINQDLQAAGFWDAVRCKQAERRTSGVATDRRTSSGTDRRTSGGLVERRTSSGGGGAGAGGLTFRSINENNFEGSETARGMGGRGGLKNPFTPRVRTPREVHESVWDKLRRSDEEDYTRMLMDCVAADDGEGIKRLMRTAEARRRVNSLNHAGLAPLHTAAHMGSAKAAKALILAGADLDLKSSDGMTAEEHAHEMNQWQIYPLIAEAKANAILSKPVRITKTPSRLSRAKRAMGFGGKSSKDKENNAPPPPPRAASASALRESNKEEAPKKKSGHRTRAASTKHTKEKRRMDPASGTSRSLFKSSAGNSRVAVV